MEKELDFLSFYYCLAPFQLTFFPLIYDEEHSNSQLTSPVHSENQGSMYQLTLLINRGWYSADKTRGYKIENSVVKRMVGM